MANELMVAASRHQRREPSMLICRDASDARFPIAPSQLGEMVSNPASWIRCLQMLAGGPPARMTVIQKSGATTVLTVVTKRRASELASG